MIRTRVVPAVVGAGFVVAFLAPMLFTDRTFGPDWSVHQWVVWKQMLAISGIGHPSLFLNAEPLGSFYPQYAFYGGTMYTVGGLAAVVVGDRPTVGYLLTYVLGVAMATGGWWWLARTGGIGRWAAFLPALAFVTSAYYVTNAYSRGDYGEFMATSALVLVLAAGVALLREACWRFGPLAAFVVAVALFSGSHAITLAWGTVILVCGALIVWIAAGAPRDTALLWRIGKLTAIFILAVLVNAWFLLPNLALAENTLITPEGGPTFDWHLTGFFNSWGNVFSLTRHSPPQSTTPELDVQLSVFVLVAAAAAIGVGWRYLDRFWRRLAALVAFCLIVLLVLILHSEPWRLVPGPLTYIQFPWRLHTYVAMATAALTIAGLAGAARVPRQGARWALVGAIVVTVALSSSAAVKQMWDVPSTLPTRAATFASSSHVPLSWYDPGTYRDDSQPLIVLPATAPTLAFPLDGEPTATTVQAPAGSRGRRVRTNLASGPDLVAVEGAERAGRTTDGFAVLSVPPGQDRVKLRPVNSAPVVMGRIASVVALVVICLLLAAVTGPGRRLWRGLRQPTDRSARTPRP